MTKRIEEVLGLPQVKGLLDEENQETEASEDSEVILGEYDKQDQLYLDPIGIINHDKEMDGLMEMASEAHKDAMELSFNMEPKHAGVIMEAASKMLDIALRASQSKVEMKNKSIETALKREKLLADLRKNITEVTPEEISNDVPAAGSFVADRNELLSKMRDGKK